MMGWMIFQKHVICFNIYFSIAFYEIIANKVALGVFERKLCKDASWKGFRELCLT